MADVTGKVAVVTGAARGVGFGIAQEFLAGGATVVITNLEQGPIDEAVAQLGNDYTSQRRSRPSFCPSSAPTKATAPRDGRRLTT